MIEFTREEVLTIIKTFSLIEGFLFRADCKVVGDPDYIFECSTNAMDMLTKKIVDEGKVKVDIPSNAHEICYFCRYWINGGVVGSFCNNHLVPPMPIVTTECNHFCHKNGK